MTRSQAIRFERKSIVPDWKPEIRRRLAGLRLSPTREAAILEELSQHLADCYVEWLAGVATRPSEQHGALLGVGLQATGNARRSAHSPERTRQGTG